jgi:hypothetical protein
MATLYSTSSTLSIGLTVYSNSNLTITASNGLYYDGTTCWQVTNGQITGTGTCVTTTTTAAPTYTLASTGTVCGSDGCSLGTISRIYLDSADYAAYVANGNSFNGLGGGGSQTCSAIGRDINGDPITRRHFDSENICWNIVNGSFTYNSPQC